MHRVVVYPISEADPDTGLAVINWIAEVTFDDPAIHERIGWYRQVEIDEVISPAERTEFMQTYQKAAGFARDTLNTAPSIIAPNAKIAHL